MKKVTVTMTEAERDYVLTLLAERRALNTKNIAFHVGCSFTKKQADNYTEADRASGTLALQASPHSGRIMAPWRISLEYWIFQQGFALMGWERS